MQRLALFCLLVVIEIPLGYSSSLLCGPTKEIELGSSNGASAALALALVKPPSTASSRAPCQLTVTSTEAAMFAVRLIDVKESLLDWEKGMGGDAPGVGRKWSARPAHAQDTTTDNTASISNDTDACKLSIFMGDSKKASFKISLCGGNAASLAARAGSKLLPPKIRIHWSPPTTPYHHTEKLRLVVTAINSGSICANASQFVCGTSQLCISSYLWCDGVAHCPGGEDEAGGACSAQASEPPLLALLRRLAARNQEVLGIGGEEAAVKSGVISDLTSSVKVTESEARNNALLEFAAALKPYGPWSYLVVGMLLCATVLMFCLAWECCCKRSKPSDTPVNIPPSCLDLSPTISVTSSSLSTSAPSPPQYEPPPSYSSLFPLKHTTVEDVEAATTSSAPEPHCSHQQPD